MHNVINEISVFEEKGGTFFFNPYNFTTVFSQNLSAEVVKRYIEKKEFNYKEYIKNNFPVEHSDEILSFMDNIVQSPLTDIVEFQDDYNDIQFAEVSFPTVHDCNLRCKYCFAKSGENYKGECKTMSEEVAEKTVKFLVNEFAPNAKSYKISFVSGGEPLLNLGIIKHVHKVVNEIKKTQNKRINIWLCTNGTILNDEVLEFLRETGQQIGISIDGSKKQHDSSRIFADGSGSYETVKANIQRIISDTAIPNSTRRIWGLTVLNRNNLDVLEIIKSNKELGINDMQIKIVRASEENPSGLGKEELLKLKQEYLKVSSLLLTTFKAGDASYFWMLANDTDYFGKFLKRLVLRTPVLYRCGAAKQKIAVTVDGDIYPCDSFVGNSEFLMGSIYDGINVSLRNRFSKLNVLERQKCKHCWARFLCGGDCYHNSMARNNCIEEPDEFMCEVLRYLCELAIKTVGAMYLFNSELFRKLHEQLLVRARIAN